MDDSKIVEERRIFCIRFRSKAWIFYAVGACVLFTLCNIAIAEITSQVGPFCLFYFSTGSILTGFGYNLYQSTQNWSRGDAFWNPQNLVVKRKVSLRNVLGFALFSMLYFVIQNLAFTTLWLGFQADINGGVICCIWSINPLFIAAYEYFKERQKMKLNHCVGFVAFLICILSIACAGLTDPYTPSNINLSISQIILNSLKGKTDILYP